MKAVARRLAVVVACVGFSVAVVAIGVQHWLGGVIAGSMVLGAAAGFTIGVLVAAPERS